jgi:hypothetical protein
LGQNLTSKDTVILNWDASFDCRAKKVDAEKELKGTDTMTTLARENDDALRKHLAKAFKLSPQSSPEELIQQLELHQRLHMLYETGRLKKCMLSAYLYMTIQYREQLLLHLGSSSITPTTAANSPPPPDVWIRLAKIAPGVEGLADKGFERTDRYFPFFNAIRTPRVLRGRKVKQYHEDELEPKRAICTARYINEVGFARTVDLDVIKDTVPYENLRILPYALEWAHAHLNIGLPLRKPGRHCGLPDSYWDT